MDSTVSCPDCNGRGESEGPDRKVYGGKGERGWIEPTAFTCETCHGTGELIQYQPAPKCKHWIFGDITVAEPRDDRNRGHDLITYKRSILLSFDTVEDFRAACRLIDPLLNGDGK